MSEKPTRALLIEDNLGDARPIQENLAGTMQAGLDAVQHPVKLLTSLKRLRKGDIGGVLLDLSLPDGQGLDTFTKMQIQAPEMPIIISSDPQDKTPKQRSPDTVHTLCRQVRPSRSNSTANGGFVTGEREKIPAALQEYPALGINLKTAKAIGLHIPDEVLRQADAIIR